MCVRRDNLYSWNKEAYLLKNFTLHSVCVPQWNVPAREKCFSLGVQRARALWIRLGQSAAIKHVLLHVIFKRDQPRLKFLSSVAILRLSYDGPQLPSCRNNPPPPPPPNRYGFTFQAVRVIGLQNQCFSVSHQTLKEQTRSVNNTCSSTAAAQSYPSR